MRHRILGYAPIWQAAHIKLSLQPFLTDSLFRRRRRFGWYWTLYKVILLAFCSLRLGWRLLWLWNYDLVIIHREAFPLGGAWFERLAARVNPRTVFDFDDATWLPIPLAVDQRRAFFDAERVARTISACAAVVAGNAYLASYARQHNPRVHIVPTPYIDLGGTANVKPVAGGVPVVVWIGNVGNEEYLDFLRAPLQRLAREIKFVFRVIGSADAAGFIIPGVEVEVLVWREEMESIWLLDSSVGVMPLHDREYERGKCAFKLVQYFSAGMPVVASPVGMNSEVVTNGLNGYLATSEEDWYASLRILLQDSATRQRMGAAAYASFRERFTRSANAALWVGVFNEVLERPTP